MEDDDPRLELTIEEKTIFVKCYQVFELKKAQGNFRGSRTRELGHNGIDIKTATVARVWGDYNRDPQHFFEVGSVGIIS